MTLVVGMDVGGTSSRAVVADLEGRVLGRGSAGGGNPVSRGVGPAMAAIRAALEEALEGLDRSDVAANVIGAAGFGADFAAHEALQQVWCELGLPGEATLVGDIEVAFASGSPEPDGSVLISGTGAIAGELVGGRPGRVADGLGWLLGDHGSGYWVGREAVRHACAPSTGLDDDLAVRVAERLTGRRLVDRMAIVAAAYAIEPVQLSELAGLVVECAGPVGAEPAGPAGRAAARILESAADELVTTLSQVRDPGDTTVVVLGGGLLGTDRLRAAVERRVADRWPGTPVRHTGSGVGGAAWLAALRVGVELPSHLHATLTGAR